MARRLTLSAVMDRRAAPLLVMAAVLGPVPAWAQSSASGDPFQVAAPPAASAPAAVDPFQAGAPGQTQAVAPPATPTPETTCCRDGIKELPSEPTGQPTPATQPQTEQTVAPPASTSPAPAPMQPAQTAQPSVPAQSPAPTPTAAPAQPPTTVQPAAPTQTAEPAPPAPAAQPVTVAAPDQPPATSPAAGPPASPPVAIDHPTFVDTATIENGGQSLQLFGIVGLPGAFADGLKGYVIAAGDHVACEPHSAADYICQLSNGTDIAMVALVNGAAQAGSDAPDAYVKEQTDAQDARRGIWASLPPPPVQVQHPTAKDTATLLANGQTYALDGIEGVGGDYAHNMQGYIAGNGDSLLCQPQGGEGHYACLLPDGTDIAKVALVNGAAQVAPNAPDAYRLQQADAIRNRRGIWADLTPVVAEQDIAVLTPPPGQPVVEEAPVDGLAYVGDTPTAVIGGETVFLMFVGGAGWGYWDHYHHWHGAPGRFAHHLDRYHYEGHGLRGYGPHGGFDARQYDIRHVEPMPGHGYAHAAGRPMVGMPGHPAGGLPGHYGPTTYGMHPGYGMQGHPGASGGMMHQQAMAAARPGGGFMGMGNRGAGGFVHPTAANLGHAAPAFHPSGGGGAVKRK